mgnify:CR=1 FL=1
MFVVIAAPLAQADPAAAARALLGLRARFDGDYPLAPDAADSGDVRALTPSPRAALETVLHLARARQWRVGLGIGAVRTPLPQAVSKRARAAGLRVDAEARTALTQLLGAALSAALSSAALNSATRSSAALRPSA